MKIFQKTFVVVFSCVLPIIVLLSYVLANSHIDDSEKGLIEQNRIYGKLISKQIEVGYLQSDWPYETLNDLSKRDAFNFWWVVKGNGTIYRSDNVSFIRTNAYDYFPQLKNQTNFDDTIYSNKENNYVIYFKSFQYGSDVWTVWVGFSLDEFSRTTTNIIITVALVVISAIILLSAILYVLVKSFTNPIVKLWKTVSEVAKGNFDASSDIQSNDEIGQLADDFNLMTNNLKKSRNELLDAQKTLEGKVEERTNELYEKVAELKQNEIATLNIMEDLQETLKELQQSQFVIEEQNVQLVKLDKIKSSFLNITSHELRTPMSAIKGYIQMMLKGNLGTINDEQKHSLEVILRNSNRLDRLIQDILDISRLESGTMKFITEKTDATKMIKEIAEIMQASADLKRIKINAETGIDVPELTIDKDRITQVVVNLLNNAIKFSPDGSTINIKTRKEKEDVLFEVQDHGRGIPEEHHKKIFQTFYQVDSDADTKFGGAGLGLAICYGIIIAHGGRIWVESTGKPGEGSTFRFTLPVESVINIEERFKGADVFGLEKE